MPLLPKQFEHKNRNVFLKKGISLSVEKYSTSFPILKYTLAKVVLSDFSEITKRRSVDELAIQSDTIRSNYSS